MCGLVGGFGTSRERLAQVWERSAERGGDSWGLWTQSGSLQRSPTGQGKPNFPIDGGPYLGYRRGEPAWEWVQLKNAQDCQPFKHAGWVVVHNGTIANDKELRMELGYRPETDIDSAVLPAVFAQYGFREGLEHVKGSYAIIAYDIRHPDRLYWAANYKPLWVLGGDGVTLASQKQYFDGLYGLAHEPAPLELGPYEWGIVTPSGRITREPLYELADNWSISGRPSVLVICSGGLDSSTVAWVLYQEDWDVTLLHFMYEARAQTPEVYAVNKLAQVMDECPVVFMQTDFFREHASSTLTEEDAEISGGEAGSEFAHEWVPARNTIMMAMAVGYAEKHGYDAIAIGTNQEESGAYPDNEMEWLNKWRELLPYAVKADCKIELRDPFGGSMKHDIIRIGHEYDMPFEFTWSCYHDGTVHCGRCGPCTMRRKAFEMEGVKDPTVYAQGAML